ncbi:MAG: hypothetical protein P4M11_13380 [Candidatus Pacebacteria bacterium]|nr:hypothetical protein [Candidatus Paceibacterota bacterium]
MDSYDLESNELTYTLPILLQPEAEQRAEILIIEGHLYLLGIFTNSKYSVFRTELQDIRKLNEESEEEKMAVVNDVSELFNSQLGSDRVLQVEGKDIFVHKEILVSSPTPDSGIVACERDLQHHVQPHRYRLLRHHRVQLFYHVHPAGTDIHRLQG